MAEKQIYATVTKDQVAGLAPGQFTLRLTGPGEIVDYVGDIVVPGGVVSRSGSIILLRDHDVTKPIGTLAWRLTGTGSTAQIIGTGTIPLGVTECGDETYRLIVAGVLTDFSIGFDPIEKNRIPTGYRYTKWRLVECSAVSIGCLPTAVVLSKSKDPTTMTREQRMKHAKDLVFHRNSPTTPTTTAPATPPMSRTERIAHARAVVARGARPGDSEPVVPGLASAMHPEVQRAVAHANAVHELQRRAHPTTAERIAHARRFLGLAP